MLLKWRDITSKEEETEAAHLGNGSWIFTAHPFGVGNPAS